jgi:uncharacterized membrane protein YgcG
MSDFSLREDSFGWHFPIDNSEQWDGFNDSGIETFLGDPFDHLGRETTQNVIDVPEGDKPVHLIYKLIEVDTSSIPYVDQLRETFYLCANGAVNEGKKAEIFFSNAQELLSKEKIKVLQVADFNTLGMKGPAENGTPYYAFMKASGQSKKTNETATGSYGIGKFAPYAVSGLRTIFVTTVYEERGQFFQLSQGKSILISHERESELRRGVGYCGKVEKCRPVDGAFNNFPKWLLRNSNEAKFKEYKGSTLSILGFDDIKNWEEFIAASIAQNFFGAIAKGTLVVEVNDCYILNQDSIHDFFEKELVREAIKPYKNQPAKFDNCKTYLAAITGDDGIKGFRLEQSEMRQLGSSHLKLLVAENMPKKICVLRNGMFITDNMNKLRRFNDYKDFVGVFECLSTKGNELLRAMEPPRHNEFEPDRLPTREEQAKGRKALNEIAKWIKDILAKNAKDEPSEVTSIDELKSLFGEEGEGEGSGNGESEEINPFGKVIIQAKPFKISMKTNATSDDKFGVKGKGDNGGGTGGGGGAGTGGGGDRGGRGLMDNGSGSGGNKPSVQLKNVRAIPIGSHRLRVTV